MADSGHPHRRHELRKSQLIDFPNVAAGHEGVKTSASGDLIVKPCKNAEVQFYQQSWKPDPDPSEFAYYMPKFFGTLNLQENPSATAPIVSPVQAVQAGMASIQPRPDTPLSTSSRGHARNTSRTVISHIPVDESLAPTKPPKKWEPSRGAKIEADNSVVLENVASGLVKPNILDVKIGARLWADDASPDKRARLDEVAAATTSGSLGFRIAGMKVWSGDGAYERENREAMDQSAAQDSSSTGPSSNSDAHSLPKPKLREDDYASYDKDYGRAMNVQNVRRGFEEYFYRPLATGIRRDHAQEVITRFLEDLKGLQAVMEEQETRMYSASLLFVYEGSGTALREDFRRENRMIREARERAEQEAEAIAGTLAGTSLQSQTSHVGAPRLPQIDTGGSLEMPAQLVMSDAQLEQSDGDDEDEDEDESTKLPKIQALRVIDFAHAHWVPGQGPDENFLTGLRNVIKILEEILNEGGSS